MRGRFTQDQAEPETSCALITGRRDRPADRGAEVIADSLATKILHAWLQNRHQTLVPLTLNLRVLTREQRRCVIDGVVALLFTGRPRADATETIPRLRQWLTGLGADPDALALFDAALAEPPPLDGVFERASALDLAVYLYVAAVVAAETRYPASVLLADVVQARFDLSNATVRSAVRRYRR